MPFIRNTLLGIAQAFIAAFDPFPEDRTWLSDGDAWWADGAALRSDWEAVVTMRDASK